MQGMIEIKLGRTGNEIAEHRGAILGKSEFFNKTNFSLCATGQGRREQDAREQEMLRFHRVKQDGVEIVALCGVPGSVGSALPRCEGGAHVAGDA